MIYNIRLSIILFFVLFTIQVNALTLATYNIRNFDYDHFEDVATNKEELSKVINGLKADLISVQEVINLDAFKTFVEQYLPLYDYILTKCGGAGHQRLGFVYKRSKFQIKKFDEQKVGGKDGCHKGLRPAAIGTFKITGSTKTITAITLHLKAGGQQRNANIRLEQYKLISTLIRNLKSKGLSNIIAFGDFNTTDYIFRNQNYDRFINFVDDNSMRDFSSNLTCTSYWWGGIEDDIQYPSLLDHILVTKEFLREFKYFKVNAKAHCQKVLCSEASAEELGMTFKEVSDHCPVVVKLR